VAEATIQWVIYERLKKELGQRRQSKEVEWTEYIVSASVAKLVAAVVTYPHEVVRTRMREPVTNTVQGSVVYKYRGVFQTLGVVAREEGLRGLYGGLTPHLLRVVPNAAIIFMCYEAVLHFGQR
jgi:solute carrier family 25 protein 33/36